MTDSSGESSGRGWMMFLGVLTIILGILLWRGWPVFGLVAIGVLVGVRILFAGIAMLGLGASAERD